MNIGFSTSVIQKGKTGVAQYVFALLDALKNADAKHRFHLFVLEGDVPLFDFVRNHMSIVTVPERFRSPAKNIAWHQTVLPRLARELSLDVLHVPSYRRMVWSHPCALVATIHDLAPFHVANKYDWKRMIYGRVVARQLAHRQHQIIAISQNTGNDIRHYFQIPSDRITVIHNGLDHNRFTVGNHECARTAICRKHGISAPFFLYVARLEHPAKNHVRLIEAFDAFKKETGSEWRLVFGGSDWHGAEEIHRRIQASPFASEIHNLGFVDPAELPTLYRAAGAFVYPSLFEGFGLPPVEAMACGCPVISSTRGSLKEVIGNAAAVVEPESVQSIHSALAEIAGRAELRNALIEEGLQQAQKFNWNKTAAATCEVYARAASEFGAKTFSRTTPATNPCDIHAG